MTSNHLLGMAVVIVAAASMAGQNDTPRLPPASANPRPASISSPDDPGLPALLATCRTPPAPRGGGRGGGQAQSPRDYRVSAIPGVVAEGQRWRFLWQEAGNNGDGIVGTDDGGLLIAQNDNSEVVKLDRNGRPSVVYSDTHTGGSLSMNARGALFIVQRGLRTGILQLEPRRAVVADRYQGTRAAPSSSVRGSDSDGTDETGRAWDVDQANGSATGVRGRGGSSWLER